MMALKEVWGKLENFYLLTSPVQPVAEAIPV